MLLKKFFYLFCCFFISFNVLAKDITLTADKQIEYHQKDQKIVAKGNAVASKDNMTIKAQTMVGYYSPSAKNKISQVEAFGEVYMTSPDTKASGDNMVYDIKSDKIILAGSPAEIKTSDSQITSQGDMIYYPLLNQAHASDNVIITDSKSNQIFTDLLDAYFTKDKQDKLILDKIDISGNIKIIASGAVINADRGSYFAQSGKIFLYDNVTIKQNGNILKGSKAETNLNTGVSRILSSPKSGRVHGIFKEKKKE